MATKPKKRKKRISRKRPRKRVVWAPGHPREPQGLIFNLCCGDMRVLRGFGKSLGTFRVDLESHGFSLTLLFNEKQATALGSGLTEIVAQARKFVN